MDFDDDGVSQVHSASFHIVWLDSRFLGRCSELNIIHKVSLVKGLLAAFSPLQQWGTRRGRMNLYCWFSTYCAILRSKRAAWRRLEQYWLCWSASAKSRIFDSTDATFYTTVNLHKCLNDPTNIPGDVVSWIARTHVYIIYTGILI